MRFWQRRWFRIAAVAGLVVLVGGSVVGVKGFHYVKTDPNFCMGCHLMEKPAEAWRHSAHKGVNCQTCHRADVFEEARLGFESYIMRKKEIGPHAKVPTTVCMECHVSNDARWKQIVATPGHASHFAKREIACLECHVRKTHEFKADTASCVRCHNRDKLKLAKMDQLHCLGCHDFLGKNGRSIFPSAQDCRACHAAEKPAAGVVTAVKSTSSLAGKAAPVWKGHENCLGCHRPHGKPLQDPIDCLACHTKLLDGESKHLKDERLTSCRECHEPHGEKP